jgi:hypothetical protein
MLGKVGFLAGTFGERVLTTLNLVKDMFTLKVLYLANTTLPQVLDMDG